MISLLQQYRTPSQPTCRMIHNNDPYFFKEEIASENLPVHIYHGVLTDAEIDVMTTKVFNQHLFRMYNSKLQGLMKKCLLANSGHLLRQMGLYGPGGHYLPHYDAFGSDLLPPDVWGQTDCG